MGVGPVEAAETVADDLIGNACRFPYTIVGALNANELPPEYVEDKTFCATFDQLAFLCEGCGWWCSTDELHNMDESDE